MGLGADEEVLDMDGAVSGCVDGWVSEGMDGQWVDGWVSEGMDGR